MSSEQGEAVPSSHLDIDFGEPAADPKTPAVEQEALVRVRASCRERKSAQNRDVNVGVKSGNQLPLGIVQSRTLQGRTQLQQRVRAANLLESQHFGFYGEDAFTDFCFGRFRLRRPGAGGCVEVILEIECGNGERFGRRKKQGRRAQKQPGRECSGAPKENHGSTYWP